MSLIREKAQLMSASEIDRTLVRLAHEILEKTKDLDLLAFIGIRRRGVPLAQRLARRSRRSKTARSRSASWTSTCTATI
jgi:pyrimidine operon attenuation protein/uracil phosphoribosyltransferase